MVRIQQIIDSRGMKKICQNCGKKTTNPENFLPKPTKSFATGRYYLITTCRKCWNVDHIVVKFGDKIRITARQAQTILNKLVKDGEIKEVK